MQQILMAMCLAVCASAAFAGEVDYKPEGRVDPPKYRPDPAVSNPAAGVAPGQEEEFRETEEIPAEEGQTGNRKSYQAHEG